MGIMAEPHGPDNYDHHIPPHRLHQAQVHAQILLSAKTVCPSTRLYCGVATFFSIQLHFQNIPTLLPTDWFCIWSYCVDVFFCVDSKLSLSPINIIVNSDIVEYLIIFYFISIA